MYNTFGEAPTLPEGYFFRVTPSRAWRYNISLRRRLWKFSYPVCIGDSTDIECRVKTIMLELKNKRFPSASTNSIHGEYPPKAIIGGSD